MNIPVWLYERMWVACAVAVLIGGVVMVKGHFAQLRLIRHSRQEKYLNPRENRFIGMAQHILFWVFAASYLVGVGWLFRGELGPVQWLAALLFFVASAHFYLVVKLQTGMLDDLRRKASEVMTSFVHSVEMKDPYTQGHSLHVQRLVEVFLRHLPKRIARRLNPAKLLDAALLHDIGKVGTADNILKKPGPLSDEEWEKNREHPMNAKKMLAGTCFEEISDWILYHHERVDGGGYYGLAGAAIPLESRIIAIADTYSALATNRVYRPKRGHARIADILREARGSQLDRELTDIFLGIPARELEPLEP